MGALLRIFVDRPRSAPIVTTSIPRTATELLTFSISIFHGLSRATVPVHPRLSARSSGGLFVKSSSSLSYSRQSPALLRSTIAAHSARGSREESDSSDVAASDDAAMTKLTPH